MNRFWEKYILDLIHGKKSGLKARVIKVILRFFSWPYQMFVRLRNHAFDEGWLRKHYPPVPTVISVGNIVAGGTGKTPVTQLIAREFYDKFSLAILSRGYRSQAERLSTPITLCNGSGPLHPASFCGDEPFLLSKNFPKAFVFVGKDRQKASYMAAKAGVQVVILDDGMQHRRLARDFEVVVMDIRDPFGNGYHLPRGFLREGLQSLSRADIIVLNHVDDLISSQEIKQNIKKYSQAPIVSTRVEVVDIFDQSGGSIGSLQGKKVGIFCGIARPEYFQDTLHKLGAEVVSRLFVSDHDPVSLEKLHNLSEDSSKKGAEVLLCTEKDWVKNPGNSSLSLPLAWVKMSLKLVEGADEWKKFIDTAKRKSKT